MKKPLTLFLLLLAAYCMSACQAKRVVPVKPLDLGKEKEKKRPENVIGVIHAPELYERLKSKKKDYILVDVREEKEYAEGHIQGAELMPWTSIRTRYKELDPEMEIIVYCRSGMRSQSASSSLMFYGFKTVTQLYGGILEWEKHNLPLVKGMTRHGKE